MSENKHTPGFNVMVARARSEHRVAMKIICDPLNWRLASGRIHDVTMAFRRRDYDLSVARTIFDFETRAALSKAQS